MLPARGDVAAKEKKPYYLSKILVKNNLTQSAGAAWQAYYLIHDSFEEWKVYDFE
jgi:hypothetical protein